MLDSNPELLESLKASDAEFAALLKRHQALDKEVDKAGAGTKGIDDVNLEAMKRERLMIRDQLTARMSAAA